MTQNFFPTLLVAAVASLLAGCAVMPPPLAADGPPVATIYVVERGWHTDVALPVAAITGPLSALKDQFPGARVLVFGFGDRAYVMSPDTDYVAMVAALFPRDAALLVTALKTAPGAAWGDDNVVALAVSQSEMWRLAQFVWAEFVKDGDGTPSRLGDGPYPGSDFYAAVDRYDALHTCNRWTADALVAAGLPIGSTGVIFAGQVMGQARHLKAQQSSKGFTLGASARPIVPSK